MASISFDKCWFPLPIIISVCSFQSQVASRVSTDFGRHGVDYSIEDTDNGCLDAEGDDVRRQRSSDGRVSTCCTTSLEPAPKTSAGVAAMVEVLKPKLYQHFGIVRVPMDYFFGMNSLS